MSTSHPNSSSQPINNLRMQNMSGRDTGSMARSAGIPPRLRNDESWIEISSQPSSSSLSSIGDEIVTTGLRVQQDPRFRRRRRATALTHINIEPQRTSTSSQEEYDESESEEDHVMTSSNEHIISTTSRSRPEYDDGSDSDNDDENSTALGRRTEPTEAFTPQPNAFSHPPSANRQAPGGGSYFPPHVAARHTSHAPSRLASRQHSAYNHQADHDAALRASLTTLLSIGAAAARGLPKRNQNIGGMAETGNTPMDLRLVPESELMGPEEPLLPVRPPASQRPPLSPSTRARSSPSISSQEAIEKGKRKASSGEKTRALKKKRVQVLEEETYISPTLMTWVVSAGVVVLVSVVGFGAGYVIGREVGRAESMGGFNGTTLVDTSNCGREAVRGSTGSLRKFKWSIGGAGAAARSVVA